jgi:hypothetical protein
MVTKIRSKGWWLRFFSTLGTDSQSGHIVNYTHIIQASPHCLSLVVNSLAQEAGQNTATGYIGAAGRVNEWVVITEGPEVAMCSGQPSRG